jgi:hypothetical protein
VRSVSRLSTIAAFGAPGRWKRDDFAVAYTLVHALITDASIREATVPLTKRIPPGRM